MSVIFNPGDEVCSHASSKRYKIEGLLNEGGFCNAYRAIDTSSGLAVFLKQYSNPIPTFKWADGFYRHQEKLKSLLDRKNSPLLERSYEYFFFENTYYQAKEFVTGTSLGNLLAPESTESFSDKQWFLNAAVLMQGIADLHDAGIVHEDMKPDNVFMEQISGGIGYRATIIDFDFSLIDGQKPPFADKNDKTTPGYVGTPTYQSPEHLRGEQPGKYSDIFTCGIILYQMLAGPHPFMERIIEQEGLGIWDDQDKLYNTYADYITQGKFKRSESYNADLAKYPVLCDTLAAMLDPDPGKRPSATKVHDVLLRVNSGAADMPVRVRLSSAEGGYREFHKNTIITHSGAKIFGSAYKFVDHRQFELLRDEKNRKWLVHGLEPVTNNTRLNGEKITGLSRELHDDDEISVGGKSGLRLTVKLIYG